MNEEIIENYADHLEFSDYENPVVFKVECVKGDTIIPSHAVTASVLSGKYGLDNESEFDVAAELQGEDEIEAVWQFAFDGAAVDDPKDVLDDVFELIENYNEPPEDLSPEDQDEWRENVVAVTDICGFDHPNVSGWWTERFRSACEYFGSDAVEDLTYDTVERHNGKVPPGRYKFMVDCEHTGLPQGFVENVLERYGYVTQNKIDRRFKRDVDPDKIIAFGESECEPIPEDANPNPV